MTDRDRYQTSSYRWPRDRARIEHGLQDRDDTDDEE